MHSVYLGQSWLFGGSTSGYLQMKGRKYGAAESTGAVGVVAGALEFMANERGMVGDWKAKSEREGRSNDQPRRATRNGGGSLFAYNSTIIAAELLSSFRRKSQNGLLSAKLPVCFLSTRFSRIRIQLRGSTLLFPLSFTSLSCRVHRASHYCALILVSPIPTTGNIMFCNLVISLRFHARGIIISVLFRSLDSVTDIVSCDMDCYSVLIKWLDYWFLVYGGF